MKNLTSYSQLSGELQKLSTSLFIGFQSKFFAIRDNGTKIAYRNLNQQNFQQKNTFLIKDVIVCEAEENFTFTLETPRRTFLLKATNQQIKTLWMKAITKLRKEIIRKKFKNTHNKLSPSKTNYILSSTDHTAPHSSSLILNLLNQTQRSIQTTTYNINSVRMTERTISTMTHLQNPEKNQEIKKDLKSLFANIPEEHTKYNIYVGNLKTKVENLFTASFTSQTYILFSSKSLYPNENMLDDNLTNMMLPPWAQVNKMYKLTNKNNPKLLFEIGKIIDVEQGDEKTSVKIRTDENVHVMYCQTIEEKQRVQKVIQTAIDNLKQVLVNGKLTRKNFDKLIWAYNNNFQEFTNKTKQIVEKFIPSSHQYQPQVVIKFIDLLLPFIQEFCLILQNKKQSSTQIILHVLKELNQETKIHIKLTWDTSYSTMKGQGILKFLNALAAYHSVIKDYISDFEFMTGMKELSKIYVRESWKNFQDIILGIVEQQKKLNLFQDQDNDYIETNSVTDLFKFIYQVFELASPCWDHKLHLHNVQKLMLRAMSVYITQLKASVDQTIIDNKQLIAIANNYFRFSITVDEFYNEKFSSLQEKTKQSYDKLKSDYKQLSMIILDKLAFDIRTAIKKQFEKSNFYKIDVEKIYNILKDGAQHLEIDSLHNLFIKRFYEKIFSTIRESILYTLGKQISTKKKHNLTKIIDQMDQLSFDLLDISTLLYKGKPKIDKDLNEINILLQCENQNQIVALVKASSEDIRNAYMNIIQLRQDYYIGGPLYYALHDDNLDKSSVARQSVAGSQRKGAVKSIRLNSSLERQMRVSFSSFYMNDFDGRSIVSRSDQESVYEPLKLISEGYLLKCKMNNQKVWEKEYFRLKNGTFYFYQNEKSQKCQNSIPVSQIIKVCFSESSKQEHLTFSIFYVSLNREKQIQLKCDSIELRDRWIDSINLQIKRVRNDQKVHKQKLKLKQKNKNHLIIDYEQLMNGKGYFSYSSSMMN